MSELIWIKNEAGILVMADVCTQCDCRQIEECNAENCHYRDGEMDNNYPY